MPNRTYALLVGINDYPQGVSRLSGCLNDVDHFLCWLGQHASAPANLAVEVLKDSEATRSNIIDSFRKHLGRAQVGDAAVFHYCGHGARSRSNPAFREFQPNGMDEGLVCHDSRSPDGYDLADKELAVLIAEVARQQVQMTVVLDCCHSGSGTRNIGAFLGLKPRVTHDLLKDRPLETYLDGHYARLLEDKQVLRIPTSRHMLLAACDKGQLAQESADSGGVFTSTLIDILQKSGGALSYADLFLRCRAAVRLRAADQEPQFEPYEGFDTGSGFLGRDIARGKPRYSAAFASGKWSINCGAMHGARSEPQAPAAFALYREGESDAPAGTANAVQIFAQTTEVQLDFDGNTALHYGARPLGLPSAPLAVAFFGDTSVRQLLEQALDKDRSVAVALSEEPKTARYCVTADAERVALLQNDPPLTIAFADRARMGAAQAAALLLPVLNNVVQWERLLALQNQGSAMNPALVEMVFAEKREDKTEYIHTGEDVTLDYCRVNHEWRPVHGKIKVKNGTAQPLYLALVYLSSAFGVHVKHNELLEPGQAWQTMLATTDDESFFLDDGVDESVDNFKLIVATEPLDAFLFEQDDLDIGLELLAKRSFGNANAKRKLRHKNEWFTRRLCLRMVRQLNQVAAVDTALADGKIVVKGHPSVTAQLSIGSAAAATRGAGGAVDFYRALQESGMSLVNFASTRGGDASVLEITGIQNGESLEHHPLQIELTLPLAANEAILPLVFDGQHVLLGGATEIGADGVTRISIDYLPDIPDRRRSLGGSLKLYFFKTYLKKANVNRLRWIEFKADGRVQHHDAGVPEKVAAARRVLLLVHGIIGDTEGMAADVRDCGLDRIFDLVLTYDYENLNTPIAETARALKAQLQTVGLHEGDDKQLTLLVHSMGGLVSRWFIEREGGNQVVDHLVMCGTPNHGSPFGQIDQARKVLEMLTAVALNYVPVLIPFACTTLMLLSRSRKLTPALEQMNPASDFIRALNDSPDPGIPYTILAGDVAAYQASGDGLFGRLLAKAGRSAAFDLLFADQPNDIAVGVDSILAVQSARAAAPVRINVACHHLNYFVSEPAQRALKLVAWRQP